jgi:hypothetical protein
VTPAAAEIEACRTIAKGQQGCCGLRITSLHQNAPYRSFGKCRSPFSGWRELGVAVPSTLQRRSQQYQPEGDLRNGLLEHLYDLRAQEWMERVMAFAYGQRLPKEGLEDIRTFRKYYRRPLEEEGAGTEGTDRVEERKR